MNKFKIYLDDLRNPIEDSWIVCRNYDEFVEKIQELGMENIEIISLDHDLGETAIKEYFKNVKNNYVLNYDNIEEKTGYDCAKWLVNLSIDSNIPLPLVLVHSANPVGSANIMGYVNNYLKNKRLPQSCIRTDIPYKM